jgi:2-oxoglutarate ferredoxin oxidoreductase subunit beta
MTTLPVEAPTLTRQDFVSDQEVRWCPGCGDYAILAQMQKIMPELGIARENIVFISGIGCSSRFPYYMDTYGIHSVHGRAPTLATGLAIANPELSIWVITGDGDALSIGGNHLLHALRRNVNLNIILFNNRIYGLTKGQYSPTSRQGAKTKSSPMGSVEQPLNPLSVALGAEATFVARTMDSNVKHLGEVLSLAAAHKGTSFVEVYQNCVIFNPTEWEQLGDRTTRDDNIIFLEHGQPMTFGRNHDKGVVLREGYIPEIVNLGDGVGEADLLVHDAHADSSHLAYLLSRIGHPVPMGVFRDVDRSTYTEGLMAQIEEARRKRGTGDLRQLYRAADLWEVSPTAAIAPKVRGTISLGMDDEYTDTIDGDQPPLPAAPDALDHELIAVLKPRPAISVEEGTSLANAVRLMNAHNIGSLLVTDDSGRLAGIFTELDILNRVACTVDDLRHATVRQFMTADPPALRTDTPIRHAVHLMSTQGLRHLPLVDDQFRPEGVISFRDVVHYLKESLFDD